MDSSSDAFSDAGLRYAVGYGVDAPDVPGLEGDIELTWALRDVIFENDVFDAVGLLAGEYDFDYITAEDAPAIADRFTAIADGVAEYPWPRSTYDSGPIRTAGSPYPEPVKSELKRVADFLRVGAAHGFGASVWGCPDRR